jgi:hypothetical protein
VLGRGVGCSCRSTSQPCLRRDIDDDATSGLTHNRDCRPTQQHWSGQVHRKHTLPNLIGHLVNGQEAIYDSSVVADDVQTAKTLRRFDQLIYVRLVGDICP